MTTINFHTIIVFDTGLHNNQNQVTLRFLAAGLENIIANLHCKEYYHLIVMYIDKYLAQDENFILYLIQCLEYHFKFMKGRAKMISIYWCVKAMVFISVILFKFYHITQL